MPSPIEATRIQILGDRTASRGDYVLYWMQQSQRAQWNHALEHAISRANDLQAPLLVAFGLMDDYPEANLRHYAFLLQGLRETQLAIRERGLGMTIQHGHPAQVAIDLARNAKLVVCDRGYLRHQLEWRERLAREAPCPVEQVESDALVPIDVASDKREFAARTIRRKLQSRRDEYLAPIAVVKPKLRSNNLEPTGLDLSNIESTLKRLKLNRELEPSPYFQGGVTAATKLLDEFVDEKLAAYSEHRLQPETSYLSYMSPYLHFGQVSPIEIAQRVRASRKGAGADRESYLEELLVRRELALNFVRHTPNYDQFECLPDWAKQTLRDHAGDRREHVYSRDDLEAASTHDEYWNAAMLEMKLTGYMHNAMRMYWGKKILEWSASPEEAYAMTLALNNKYFLDGRDANSFANVGWVFGLHDRPWQRRPIFGTVRYMAASGLKRKSDIEAYVRQIRALAAKRASSPGG